MTTQERTNVLNKLRKIEKEDPKKFKEIKRVLIKMHYEK